MRIFLTGATGYIGSAVLDALVRGGHDVTALVRNKDPVDEFRKLTRLTQRCLRTNGRHRPLRMRRRRSLSRGAGVLGREAPCWS